MGPFQARGYGHFVTKLGQTGITVRQSRSFLQLCHPKKNISQAALGHPWCLQEPGQVSDPSEAEKTHPQLCHEVIFPRSP